MPIRGEIWLADLTPRRGTETGKTRPVLIDQLRAIDNRRLVKGPLTRLDRDEMVRVADALLETLDLFDE